MNESQPLGGPPGGTVSALTVAVDTHGIHHVFIGGTTGLFNAPLSQGGKLGAWQRLPNAPLGILALAVSPCFANDQLLIVGTDVGINLSTDNGASWSMAQMPVTSATILTLAFSPHFAEDGVLLAGTLEDGVWVSQDRGRTWEPRNFGLLDSTVFCIAFSPSFATDGTIFIGTDGALYQSYNGARAWKEIALPEEVAPVLSLAISSHFATDGVLAIGTEQQGLLRSTDHGLNWTTSDLPAQSINALCTAAQERWLAATNAGLFASVDSGCTWQCVDPMTNVLCLAATQEFSLAGLLHDGLAVSHDRLNWSLANTPPMRSIIGLTLSPHFEQDRIAYLYGPQDGIWRSVDGGHTWHDVGETLPSEDIHAVVMNASNRLFAAASDALYLSTDHGDHWQPIWQQPVQALACSFNDDAIVLADAVGQLHHSNDHGQHWQPLPLPASWPTPSRVLALSVQGEATYIALDQFGDIAIWSCLNRHWQQLLCHPNTTEREPVVRFWQPSHHTPSICFVSIGSHLWQLGPAAQPTIAHIELSDEQTAPDDIIALAGTADSDDVIFACTHRYLWRCNLGDANPTLTQAHDFGDERAVAFTLAPNHHETGISYAALLGGTFTQLNAIVEPSIKSANHRE